MKLTKQKLKSLEPCPEGYEWYLKQNTNDLFELVDLLIKEEHYKWCGWIITKFLNKKQYIQYAVNSVERVLYFYEKEYPKDNRLRKAIEVAKEYLKDSNLINEDIFIRVSDAADDAYCDVSDASCAAYFAADNATYDVKAAATYVARAVCHVTYVVRAVYHANYVARAVYDATYVADYAVIATVNNALNAANADKNSKSLKTEIVKYGIKLLKEK